MNASAILLCGMVLAAAFVVYAFASRLLVLGPAYDSPDMPPPTFCQVVASIPGLFRAFIFPQRTNEVTRPMLAAVMSFFSRLGVAIAYVAGHKAQLSVIGADVQILANDLENGVKIATLSKNVAELAKLVEDVKALVATPIVVVNPPAAPAPPAPVGSAGPKIAE